MEIFCPNNHLILANPVCTKCGWKRPVEGQVGKLYWPILELNTILGGISREGFTSFTGFKNNLLIPTKNNEIISISMDEGSINWRIALPKGQRATDLTTQNGKVFVTFQDTHSLIEGIKGGNISLLEEKDHLLTPVWATSSHDLTPPLFHSNRIFLRTAESKVYCLQNFSDLNPIWIHECLSWWPTPLSMHKDQVIYIDGNPMLDETEIIAANSFTGDVSWKHQCASRPTFHINGNDEFIILIFKARSMVILDSATGKQVFEQTLPKYYSRPVIHGNFLFYTARGSETDPDGYYQFHCLSLKDFEPVFRSKLENRVRISPALAEEAAYLADDEGNLLALSVRDGKEIWRITGDKEDPIRTNIYLSENQLYFATYSGKVFAITIRQPKLDNKDPKDLIKSGDFKEAAAAYAIGGNFAKAAEIYSGRIVDIERALQLYEQGNLMERAAKLAFDNNLYSRALDYYRSVNDLNGEAKTLLAMGDMESASKLFYTLGDKSQAAELMEQAGKPSVAAKLYKEVGRMVDYVRLIIKTSLDVSEVEALRKAGNFEVAADWQMQNGSYIEASKDFREAGLFEKELEAFRLYLQSSDSRPEPWMWQRVAELGENQSDYMFAARAWSRLDRPNEAGEAYLKYADQLANGIAKEHEAISSPLHVEAANYYRIAAESFHEAGIVDREEHCKEMVRKYQLLPKIIVLEVKTATGLREMEWNNLSLTIKNIGYGRAREIKFQLNEDYFTVEADPLETQFNLAPNHTRTQQIHIKPLRDEVGDWVPLQIDWSWKDSANQEYHDRWNNSVAVAKPREELSSQPIYFNVQNIEGDYVTQKGDRVDIVHGNSPLGDSKMTVSSNGIEVTKDFKVDTPLGQIEQPLKKCSSCNRTIPSVARVCPYCRIALSVK